MTARTLLLLFLVLLTQLLVAQPSNFIHVDQFGYQTMAEKIAVLADPQQGMNSGESYTPSTNLEIKNANNDQTVWTGSPQIWNNGATHLASGDKGWWLDFSVLTTPGDYYLVDVANNQQSGVFTISDQVYDNLLKDAGRAFFYNRCNAPKAAPYAESGWTDGMNFTNALQDTECSYVNDRENAALRRDLSGGWFDAGDYNKYVTFAQSAVPQLLWAYTESSSAFSDSWNIPESGNGIPDLLDEVKWEIDWLRKMVNSDGSTIIKMGSISHSENISAPPSANTDRRYYGPTCTSASIAAAAMLAQASEVFQQIPAWTVYASEIETQAAAAFNYWRTARQNNALETDCDDGTIKAGDADRTVNEQREIALTAAIHLFSLTGENQYQSYIQTYYNEVEPMTSGWWGPYKMELQSAMLHYTTLSNADAAVANAIRNSFAGSANANSNGFIGFNADDLYRAFMPDWSFHWGSNSFISRYANLNRLLVHYGINTINADDYTRKAENMLHYLHGVNPLGMVYLSAMEGRGAERGIQEIYHTWFNDGTQWDNVASGPGPAPGFVTGGPNKDFSVSSIIPPAGQPTMKSYKDWNTGWPQNSWEISEPAIYYQAAYIRNLAAQMVQEIVLPVVYAEPLSATARNRDVLLEWRSAREINANRYEVEHLDASDNWVRIGSLFARNASRYQFVHEQPLDGQNNYRLKQLDHDEQFSYSNIASVNFRNRYREIKLFPNPVGETEVIEFRQLPIHCTLQIYDPVGRLVLTKVVNDNQLSVSLAGLPAGWYGVELLHDSEGVVWRSKVVKK